MVIYTWLAQKAPNVTTPPKIAPYMVINGASRTVYTHRQWLHLEWKTTKEHCSHVGGGGFCGCGHIGVTILCCMVFGGVVTSE